MNESSLINLLVQICGNDEPHRNRQLALFETQALDSMRVVELIVELDEKFGISISPAAFDRACWATPALFIEDVEARIAAKS